MSCHHSIPIASRGMARRLFLLSVTLVVSIGSKPSHVGTQQDVAQLKGESQSQTPRKRKGNPPQSEATPTQKKAAYDQRGAEESPLVIKTVPSQKSQEQASQEQYDRDEQTSNKRWMICLTGLTVLVGLIQAFLIWSQARIGQRQNTIMETQSAIMSGQLQATETAANAARESAEIAKRSLETTERAYLHPIRWDIDEFRAGARPICRFAVKNFGRTPAMLTEISFASTYDSVPPQQPPSFTRAERVKISLPASSTYRKSFLLNTELSQDLFGEIMSERIKLWIFLQVSYTDVFQRLHVTRTCRKYSTRLEKVVIAPEVNYADAD